MKNRRLQIQVLHEVIDLLERADEDTVHLADPMPDPRRVGIPDPGNTTVSVDDAERRLAHIEGAVGDMMQIFEELSQTISQLRTVVEGITSDHAMVLSNHAEALMGCAETLENQKRRTDRLEALISPRGEA